MEEDKDVSHQINAIKFNIMKGCLYFDEIQKIWYVNWQNTVELYPSVSLGGRMKLHPDDAEVINVFQMYLGEDKTLNDKEVEYTPIDGYAKLIEPGTNYTLSLYGKIESSIIEWSNDGTKTAGELTRKIIKIIEEK